LSTATALLLLLLSARDGDYVIFGAHGLIEATSGGDRTTKKLQACASVPPIRMDRQTDRICSVSVTNSADIAPERESQKICNIAIIKPKYAIEHYCFCSHL